MKLFRVKKGFTNGSGFIREGAAFIAISPIYLPEPHGFTWKQNYDQVAEHYQEVKPKLPAWAGNKSLGDFITLEDVK